MRLWHEDLLPVLPRQQLLGQHRECCALRGNGWGKKHATVDYVFRSSPAYLFRYHAQVMKEMQARGYQVDPLWEDPYYRGKKCIAYERDELDINVLKSDSTNIVYPEHDEAYLEECLENLREKGIEL